MSGSTPASCADYHVAWICPVADLELLPARLMLDEEHPTPPYDTHYDENTYLCGTISGHAVVVATCPQGGTGNVNAGRLTGPMFKTFPNIRMAVLVGVGGGIPREEVPDEPLDDIHLGDVVVGWPGDDGPACVYHERGKAKVDGEFHMVGTIQNPDWRLTQALSILASDHEMGKTTFEVQLRRLQRTKRAKKFAHPGLENDKLFRAEHHHVGSYGSGCKDCDASKLVERPQRTEENLETLVFHQGRIATGNAVIQDAELRDKIRARCNGALCVEMEAAGVDASRRCLVVRGISNYADSHKNDLWRAHAAGNAAAPQTFVGRGKQLALLNAHILSEGCCRYAVYGLGGCGKTALALEIAYRTREQQPQRAVFWVPAISQADFEQAYREIGLLLRIPDITDAKADVKTLVKARLSDESFGQWLVIVDNADDDSILFSPLKGGKDGDRLIDYLPYSQKGSLIFTTRVVKAAHNLAANNVIELGMFDREDAKEVLRTRLFEKYQHLVEDEVIADEFLDMLTCLALAIVQAAAFINQNDIQLSEYIQLYRASEQQATQLLSEEFQDQGRYQEMKNPIATTWYISFDQITSRDELAAEYLSFMACTANNDIPESMLPVEESQLKQTKAIGTLKAYAFITERRFIRDEHAFQQEQTQMLKRSFNIHPLVHLAMRGWLKSQNQLEEIVPNGDYRTREMWTPYLPHAKYVMGVPEIFEQDIGLELLERVGGCELMLGRYRAAEGTYRQMLVRAVSLFGEENPGTANNKDTIHTLGNLGSLFSDLDKNEEAEQIFQEILAITNKVFGKEHPHTIGTMNSLAKLLWELDRYEEAEQICRDSLALAKKTFGKEHPITLTGMGNLARVLLDTCKYEEIEQMFLETLGLAVKALGKEHPTTQNCLEIYIDTLNSWDVVRVCCLRTTVASAVLALGRNIIRVRCLRAAVSGAVLALGWDVVDICRLRTAVASAVLTFDRDVGIHSFSPTSQWLSGHGH
ncbi:hypothetical protein PSV08DRAFT_411191 [Bipolaris maydis]|uniref:uncharacterized protein n=1 Tax=Cochliobolus heterostrophus TaxID=5016 RepID=UPI0024D239CB|nr:hypothetical protein PSV08DRAFT_411191 [Bipolaris maydis]KAJ6278425.1 hypothetical protein J3E71DRAFT_393598 [Bipolaris maydis]